MSKLPIINISSSSSSESSSTDEAEFYKDSAASSGPTWSDYFPQTAPKARKREFMKPNEGPSTRAPSHELDSSASSDNDNDDTYDITKELSEALNTAISTAISNMKKIEIPERSERKPKSPKPVLCLPCPRLYASFEDKKYNARKAKNTYQGKGKKPME